MDRIKKAACILGAGAALAVTSAFAQDVHRQRGEGYRGWDHRPAVVDRRHYRHAAPRFVVEAAPPAYYVQPGYYAQPQPAYYGQPAYGGPEIVNPGVVVGAAAGAMIGSQLGDRHNRAATTAIGALLGGLLGSQM